MAAFSRPEVFCKKGSLSNFAKFKIPTRKGFSCRKPEAYNFIKKETLVQVLSCEVCEISKNTFPPLAASADYFHKKNNYYSDFNFHVL